MYPMLHYHIVIVVATFVYFIFAIMASEIIKRGGVKLIIKIIEMMMFILACIWVMLVIIWFAKLWG